MYCSRCGKQLPDEAKFCFECGNRIVVQPKAPVSPPAAHDRPAPKVQKQAASKPKLSPLVPLFIILVCILVLAIVVILCIQFFPGSNTAPAPTNATVSTTDAPVATVPLPSDVVEDPNPLSSENPYRECYDPMRAYILPESDSRYISQADLEPLNNLELALAAYEIDARHGFVFSDSFVREYFDQQDWYTAGGDQTLTDMESINRELILVCTGLRDGTIYHSDNPYIPYLGNPSSYRIYDSAERYLTSTDLLGLGKAELAVIRTEIFARHGYIFSGKDLRQFYFCKDWYVPQIPGPDFNNDTLNKKEAANVALIKVYEKILGGVSWSSKNPYHAYYDPYVEYIIPDSSTRKLTDYDVMYLDKQQLILARNEIYARHGYCFSSDNLEEYFAHCSWYVPEVAPGRDDLIKLSKTESANIKLLKEYQSYWD